ncbi:MAG: SDR family oxidoreductase [Gammaproteobacteria bacterium]|nr:SDR family oxidoreductase [Gammaproteobacteria bacterium]
MTNHIEGKTIVVTGAAGGFGRLLCEKAAASGAHVVAADIQAQALDEVVSGIRSQNGEAIGVTADVADLQQMHGLAGSAVERYGAIDVMVNNAGIMPLAFFADHARAYLSWTRCIDVNFKGVLNGILAVHDQMISQGRGHVLNVSSIYGNYPTAGSAVYAATKAAVVFLSESLRIESQGKIKVTTIRPTGVPATGLSAGIVNPEAAMGLLGINGADYVAKFQAAAVGELPGNMLDVNDIEYFSLDPSSTADQILYAINQPWGVAISDLTIRASGDGFVI